MRYCGIQLLWQENAAVAAAAAAPCERTFRHILKKMELLSFFSIPQLLTTYYVTQYLMTVN